MDGSSPTFMIPPGLDIPAAPPGWPCGGAGLTPGSVSSLLPSYAVLVTASTTDFRGLVGSGVVGRLRWLWFLFAAVVLPRTLTLCLLSSRYASSVYPATLQAGLLPSLP